MKDRKLDSMKRARKTASKQQNVARKTARKIVRN